MQVVILCGGEGTRLREETEFRPKPLVEIGQRPILWHIMKGFGHYGLRQFVLCLGYRGFMVKEFFLNYEVMTNDFTIHLGNQHNLTLHGAHAEQDFQVTLADTGLATLTGGRVKRVERYINGDDFIVTYGDGLADVNISDLISFHRSHGKLATVTGVRPTSRFGMLDVDRVGQVRAFNEKPQLDGWASGGYFVFNRSIFDRLEGDACVLEAEPLEQLAREGQLRVYRHEGFFFAMDTYREYLALCRLWDQGEAPWKVWDQ